MPGAEVGGIVKYQTLLSATKDLEAMESHDHQCPERTQYIEDEKEVNINHFIVYRINNCGEP